MEGILRDILNYALSSGADEAEIFAQSTKNILIRSEGNRIFPSSRKSLDIVIRVSIGKKVGSVTTTTSSPQILKEEVDKALSIARISEEDRYWGGFPDPEPPKHNITSFSEELSVIDIEELSSENNRVIKDFHANWRDLKMFETYDEIKLWEKWIFNSRGVETYDKGTVEQFFAAVKGHNGSREISIYDVEAKTDIIDNKHEIVNALGNRVKKLFNAKKLDKSLKGDMIFHPKTLSEIIYFVFCRAINANNVLEGRSPLVNKIGRNIAYKELIVVDDGSLENGLYTSLYDDEGVPKGETIIIDRGELKTFLHNTYTARREGVNSTGNAFRHGGTVAIRHSNIIFSGRLLSMDKLMASIDMGIYVEGLPLNPHSSNYVTGEINAALYEAYLIRKGSIEHPLYPLNLSGNIYEAFKEVRFAGKPMVTPLSIYLPYTLLTNLTVV